MRRLLMAGGGTGGHVYPLLAVLEALQEEPVPVEVSYVGASGGIEERLAGAHRIPFYSIPAAGVRGLALVPAAVNLARLVAGWGRALGHVRRVAPDVVLVTGGYVSVPVVLAAWVMRCPVVICLPDMEPGLAVRTLARLASIVTVSFPEVQATLPAGKTIVTGYPVRRGFLHGDRAEARRRLGIAPDDRLLVVFGGSRGARSINNAVLDALPQLLALAQVCHITGAADYERVRSCAASAGTCASARYRIYSYVEDEMADLLRAADLVVARAGAAILGEFPAAGVPSILVPYPHAGGHQSLNATYLQDRGAALIIEDGDLGDRFLPAVRDLLSQPERLAAMVQAARSLARPEAARAIVGVLRSAADRQPFTGRR